LGGEKLKLSQPFSGLLAVIVFFVICFFGSIVPSYAQDESREPQETESLPDFVDESAIVLGETAPSTATNGGSSVLVILRMLLVLALAALAIYGVVFFIKRLARPQEIRDPHLKILARVPLSGDSFAAVLSLGAKAWLVGGGSAGVNLISEIEDTETLETLLLEEANRSAETRRYFDFGSLIRRLSGKAQSGNSQQESGSLESLRKQSERLKRL
jgi:flagellar protein FliO/FliZ